MLNLGLLIHITELCVSTKPIINLPYRPFVILRAQAKGHDLVIGRVDGGDVVRPQEPLQHRIGRALVALHEAAVHQQTMKQVGALQKTVCLDIRSGLLWSRQRGFEQFRAVCAVVLFAPNISHQIGVQLEQEAVGRILHGTSLGQSLKHALSLFRELVKKLPIFVAQRGHVLRLWNDHQVHTRPFRNLDRTVGGKHTVSIGSNDRLHRNIPCAVGEAYVHIVPQFVAIGEVRAPQALGIDT